MKSGVTGEDKFERKILGEMGNLKEGLRVCQLEIFFLFGRSCVRS